MRYFLIFLIFVFYLFFFLRAYLLSKELRKPVKAKNSLVNSSVFFAGLSSVIFLFYLLFPEIGKYLFIIGFSPVLRAIGAFLISMGLIISILSSLNMKKSWRIGVDENEKTELIETGLYKISRNPYFLSYDLVLIGMLLSLPSLILFITVIITIILFHLMILKEEKYLENLHGEKYRKYKKRVRRYI